MRSGDEFHIRMLASVKTDTISNLCVFKCVGIEFFLGRL